MLHIFIFFTNMMTHYLICRKLSKFKFSYLKASKVDKTFDCIFLLFWYQTITKLNGCMSFIGSSQKVAPQVLKIQIVLPTPVIGKFLFYFSVLNAMCV